MMFQNREEAGHRLAIALQRYRNHPEGVILALPRGGVAVGYAMSLDLHLPLDVFITRKIGAPGNPEYALGALSETGNLYLNREAVTLFHLSATKIEELARVQREEIHRRQQLYRPGRHSLHLKDRVVILVDDGIATGATFFASVEAIRREHPRVLIGAVSVGPPETIDRARDVVDTLVVLATPGQFWSVGSHYAEFAQVSDEEVVHYLKAAERAYLEKDRESGHFAAGSPKG
ncbi:MAG TPA: phosphoribosyltransferase family protein [Nitrospira sp.]|nr:phosphoribosyltransferase family protein [Nitrospira sp.]